MLPFVLGLPAKAALAWPCASVIGREGELWKDPRGKPSNWSWLTLEGQQQLSFLAVQWLDFPLNRNKRKCRLLPNNNLMAVSFFREFPGAFPHTEHEHVKTWHLEADGRILAPKKVHVYLKRPCVGHKLQLTAFEGPGIPRSFRFLSDQLPFA